MEKKPTKKFYLKKSVIVCSIILAIVTLLLYSYLRIQCNQLSIEVSNSDLPSTSVKIAKMKEDYNTMQTCSEIVLVVFSVVASSVLSAVFIEKRNSNKLIEDVLVEDFLTSKNFTKMLDDKEKEILLKNLESACNFHNCAEKSEMYMTIINKLNAPIIDGKNLYYEKYYLDIKCNITDKYIEKNILKRVKIKTLGKPLNDSEFLLLSAVLQKLSGGENPVNKPTLKINGIPASNKCKLLPEKEPENLLDKKRGYDIKLQYVYDGVLNFSNKKSIEIEIEYTTKCPLNDLIYTCRLPYPCKNFDFNFSVKDDCDYTISPAAFGFINDAANCPNRSGDRKSVSIKFDEWIFPLDGVCVCLEKNP